MKSLIHFLSGKLIKPYRGLPAGVYILFITRIINRMGDFANFFLTMYLTRYLGFSEKQTGLVLTLVGVSMMAGAMMGGRLTDFAGRKKVMLLLQGITASSVIICGFIPDKPAVAWIILIFTFFNGAVRPVNTSLLTDLTTQEQRSSAFSLLYLGINIGVAAGPILAGFLFNHYRRWIFWGDGLTTIIAILLIIFFIKEPVREEMKIEKQEEHDSNGTIRALLNRPVLARYTLISIFCAFLYSQNNFTLPLQILNIFADKGPRFFGFIMSFNAVAVLALTPILNQIYHNKTPLTRIAIGQIFYGLGFGLLLFPVHTGLWFFLSTFLWTIGEVLDAISGGVFVANHSPVNHRGRFNSLFLITKGGGRALGPLVSGFVLEFLGFSWMWGFSFVLGLILAGSLKYLNKEDVRRKNSTQIN